VWRVGKGKYACILSLITAENVSPDHFKEQLSIHEELVHITIEINGQSTFADLGGDIDHVSGEAGTRKYSLTRSLVSF
jgi:hypothetical protein